MLPATIPEVVDLGSETRETVLLVVAGGMIGVVGFLFGLSKAHGWYAAGPNPFAVLDIPLSYVTFWWYAVLGSFTVGGLVALLYHRYRTVVPPIIVGLVYVFAVSWTWRRIQSWKRSLTIGPGHRSWVSVFEYVLLAWPLVMGSILVVAALERHITHSNSN